MKIYFKNDEVVEITEGQHDGIKGIIREGKKKKFSIGEREYRTNNIKFIGRDCYNKKCSRQEHAHPKDEICDYDYTDSCAECNKRIWKRDADYSYHLFYKVYCAKHIPDKDKDGKPTVTLKKL